MNFLKRIVGQTSSPVKPDAELWQHFEQDFITLKQLESKTRKRFSLNTPDFHPCLYDKTAQTGFDRHYVYHTAWAARALKQIMPEKHIDISSSLYFVGIASAFVPIDFYDYRPAELYLDHFSSGAADLMALPFESGSVESISCMHVIEHVGLGRYGDPLDYDGDLKAIAELIRVVRKGGSVLFVTPTGWQSKIMFNAHRIYTKEQVIDSFKGMELVEFTFIPEHPEQGGLVKNPPASLLKTQTYGCGCYWFRKTV